MINLDKNHLFYVEPSLEQKSSPTNDSITRFVEILWNYARSQDLIMLHRGSHLNCDGTHWNGVALLNIDKISIEKQGGFFGCVDNPKNDFISTHAGCVHYVKNFRAAIPESEWIKLLSIALETNISLDLDRDSLIEQLETQIELSRLGL